tara:strand:+ start:4333 stop:4785 length:453 start_codon:yes stop_codon:yes gene_type:complete
MGDDMGGFRHGGPLMGYRDGGWPPWKKSILPYQDLPYEGIGLSKPAQGSLLGRAGRGIAGGLPAILAMMLSQYLTSEGGKRHGSDPLSEIFWPEKLGGSGDDVLKEMRERVWRDKMDERHGLGWSPDPVQTPRINPGRRIDLSRVMRAGR